MFNRNNKKNQLQKQKTLSAYNRKVVHDTFDMTMEWLEKYIEVAGYYPDWDDRKQIKNNNIKRADIIGNPEKAEDSFSTQLFLFEGNLEDEPLFLREELKEEFYRWINATKIDVINCPGRLKHALFGINEILEGRGEKIREDVKNRRKDYDINSPEYMEKFKKTFASIQIPLNNEREIEKSLEGKNYDEVTIESKFADGKMEKGEEAFKQIAKTVSSHDDFHFYPQKESQQIPSSSQQKKVLAEKVKQNLSEWKLKEVVIFKGYYGSTGEKKELALVHNSAGLKKYDWKGNLEIDPRMIYFKKDHQPEEWVQIEQFYSNKVTGSNQGNSQEIRCRDLIAEIKRNKNDWEIRKSVPLAYYLYGGVKSEGDVLIRKKVRLNDNHDYETSGELINQLGKVYRWDYFNEKEWAEINGVFERISTANQSIRWEIVDTINQQKNKFKVEKVVVLNEEINDYEEELWIIHDLAKRDFDNKDGRLIFDSENMFKVKDLTETEKQAIGYNKNKSEVGLQNNSFVSNPKNDNKLGAGGILAIIGVVSLISVVGVLLVRKKLNNKSKD